MPISEAVAMLSFMMMINSFSLARDTHMHTHTVYTHTNLAHLHENEKEVILMGQCCVRQGMEHQLELEEEDKVQGTRAYLSLSVCVTV